MRSSTDTNKPPFEAARTENDFDARDRLTLRLFDSPNKDPTISRTRLSSYLGQERFQAGDKDIEDNLVVLTRTESLNINNKVARITQF